MTAREGRDGKQILPNQWNVAGFPKHSTLRHSEAKHFRDGSRKLPQARRIKNKKKILSYLIRQGICMGSSTLKSITNRIAALEPPQVKRSFRWVWQLIFSQIAILFSFCETPRFSTTSTTLLSLPRKKVGKTQESTTLLSVPIYPLVLEVDKNGGWGKGVCLIQRLWSKEKH